MGRSVRCWTGGTARGGPAGRPSPAPPRGRITVASPGGYSRAFKQTAPVAVRQDHPDSGPPTPQSKPLAALRSDGRDRMTFRFVIKLFGRSAYAAPLSLSF